MTLPVRNNERDLFFLPALKNEHMKTFVKRDASQRVLVLYEAPVHAEHGDECLATVYYYESSNAQPTATKERVALWDSAWETNVDAILVNGDVGYTP